MTTNKGLWCLGAAVIAIAALAYVIYDTSGDNHNTSQSSFVSLAAELDNMSSLHLFDPKLAVPGQQQIWLPHRYPDVSGGNISTVIHQGFASLNKRAPEDADWIDRPPGEVAW